MKFSISLLKETQSLPVSFQETIVIPSIYGLCEEGLLVEFSGYIIKNPDAYADSYTLKGRLTAILPMNCNKCLERVDIPMQLEVNERFFRKGSIDPEAADKGSVLDTQIPEDVFYFDDESIDIAQVIEPLVYLNIPSKVVCGESCKGLCSHCGQNFNRGDCCCEEAVIDPRFLVLHSFFKDKEV